MSENPTIPQLLQRLAVVAPEWCKIESRRGLLHIPYDCFCIYEGGESSIVIPTSSTAQDSFDRRMLFGAACEKIDSLGWSMKMATYTGTKNSKHVIEVMVPYQDGGYLLNHKYGGKSNKCSTNATLQALLAALEGREEECPECEGEGWVPDYSGTYGRLPEHAEQVDCPACQGSGKKQEVKA